MPDELNDPTLRGWEDYWAIGLRRRWWILLPLFLCWAAVWGASWFLPTTYQSEALILVEQQKVPDQYVMPNVTESLQSRLQTITQQILSRTRLQTTIDRFHLYSKPRGIKALLKPMDPVDQMRKDIQIDLEEGPGHQGGLAAFRMHYSADSPDLAQEVNSELTSLFVEENVRAQQQLSNNTTAFLESQLKDANAKMEAQEAKVAAFKARHMGDLPSQLEGNVQVLAGLQAQLQNTQHVLEGSKQQKIYLESMLQQIQSASPSVGAEDSSETLLQTFDKELLDMRLRLEDMHSRYTDDYPDMVLLKDQIAKTEKLKQQTESAISSSQGAPKATSTPDPSAAGGMQRGSSAAMMQIQSQLKANQQEIQNDEMHQNELQSQMATYLARLNMTPATELELVDISRGYEESKMNYGSLLQKQMQSQLASNLEQRQQGEQFSILDPPSLPAKPSSPNHFRISLGGLVLGVVVSAALIAFLELTDVRVRQEKDLEGIVPVRVLVGIPRLNTPRENRSRLRTQWMEVGVAVAMAVLMVIGNLYALYKG